MNIRILIAVAMWVVTIVLVATKRRYNELFRCPSRWKISSWKGTLLISLGVLSLALLVIPIVEDVVKENVGAVIDRTNHPHIQIASRSPWLLGAITVPIAFIEELIFRGIFLDLIKRHSNVFVALILSSFMFSVYHLSDPTWFPPFLIVGMMAGLIFSLTYLKLGILGSFLVHGGYNMGVIVLGVIL